MNHKGHFTLMTSVLGLVILLSSISIFLGLSTLARADFIPEPNPPGFDAPDPEQNPNFNCPPGYFFEGNHEYLNGPARCTLMTCQNFSNLCNENNSSGGITTSTKSCNPPSSNTTPVAAIQASDAIMPALERMEGYNGIAGPPDIHVTNDRYGLYDDLSGFCTLGFGHLVHGHSSCTEQDIANYLSCGDPTGCTQQSRQNWQESHPDGQGQTKEDAETQLRTDIQTKEEEISAALGSDVKLTQNQFDALLLLTFNAGATKTLGQGHTLGDNIRAGNCDHTTIANDFRLYNRSHGEVIPQLTIRREIEAMLFNFGIYPLVVIR